MLLIFWNYQDIQSTYLTAHDSITNQPLLINGQNKFEAKLLIRKPKVMPKVVVTRAGTIIVLLLFFFFFV